MKNHKHIDWKDVGIRAVKTFAQAFLAAVSVDRLFTAGDADTAKQMLYSMVLAGAAAGVSAVWNMLVALAQTEEEKE